MKRSIIFFIMLFMLVTACSDDNSGVQAAKPAPHSDKIPERIISLAPAITEELYLLGAEDILVANTFYCKRPVEAIRKRKIGNLKNFDIELILELKPDLILCTSLANRNKIDKLKQLGVRVVELPPPSSFKEICDNFLNLGSVIGKEERAKKIISDVTGEINEIRKLTEKLPKKKLFMQIGANPLVTVNRDYFINDYIRYSGGINISGDAVSNLYNRENVLVANPDVIIITNMGIASDEEMKAWERYTTINAVRDGKIYIVDSDTFCNPTIITFLESLKTTALFLHPEIRTR